MGFKQPVSCFCCKSHLGVFAICIRAATGGCGNCQWLERPCSLDPDAQPVSKKVKRKATIQEELISARDEMISLISEHGILRERCRQLNASMRDMSEKMSALQEKKLITGMVMRGQRYSDVSDRLDAQDIDLVDCRQALRDLSNDQDRVVALMEDTLDQWETFAKIFL